MAAEGGNEAMKEPPKVVLRCKLCMVGDAGVGKTALTEVYTKSKFPKSYTMTSEAAFTVSTVDVAGEDVGSKSNLRVELCIFDVPGQGICREASLELVRSGPSSMELPRRWAAVIALTPVRWTQCKDAAAICVVFDCSNEQSFENCAIWTDEIRSRSGRDHIRGPPPLSAPPLLLLPLTARAVSAQARWWRTRRTRRTASSARRGCGGSSSPRATGCSTSRRPP